MHMVHVLATRPEKRIRYFPKLQSSKSSDTPVAKVAHFKNKGVLDLRYKTHTVQYDRVSMVDQYSG